MTYSFKNVKVVCQNSDDFTGTGDYELVDQNYNSLEYLDLKEIARRVNVYDILYQALLTFSEEISEEAWDDLGHQEQKLIKHALNLSKGV